MTPAEEVKARYGWREDAKPAPAKEVDEITQLKQRYAGDAWRPASTATSAKQQAAAAPEPAPRVRMDNSRLEFATPFGRIKTPIPLNEGLANSLAQIGSGIADYDLGWRQITGQATKAEADEKARLDEPLNKGALGTLYNFVGKAAPTMILPAGAGRAAGSTLGPVLEGALTGAGIGALEPERTTGPSRTFNTVGAGLLGGTPAAMLGMGRKAASVDAETARLIAAADRHGIPLSLGDTTTNKLVKAFRSLTDDSVFPGMSSKGLKDEQIEAFNRAIGNNWGSNAARHTPDVRAADKKRITDVMENVWGNHNLPYDANLFGALRKMESDAVKYPGQTQETIMRHIQDLESKVVADPSGNLYIPGLAAKEFQTDLFKNFGNKGAGADALDNQMMQLRGNIIDNFNANVTGPEAAALSEARRQYRAFKTAEPALQKADVGVAGREIGNVRPTDLSASVLKNYKGDPAASPYGDLPAVGQRFLTDRVERTGGSNRALLQNTGVLGLLSGVGTLGTPLAAGATWAGGALSSQVLNRPSVRRALQREPYAFDKPATQELIESSLTRLPPAALPGALSIVLPRPGSNDDEAKD